MTNFRAILRNSFKGLLTTIIITVLGFGFSFFTNQIQAQCTHTIALTDAFGDGWNGGAVTVYVDGTAVLSNLTLSSGSGYGPVYYTFTASTGSTINVTRTADGLYPSEMRIQVTGTGSGGTVIALTQPAASPGTSGIGSCNSGSISCTHTIALTDTFGYGWEGAAVTVYVNGSAVLSNIDLSSGYGPVYYTFAAYTGSLINVTRTADGLHPDEIRFQVYSDYGSVIGLTTPVALPGTTAIGNCGGPDPCLAAINIPFTPVTNQTLVCTSASLPGNLNAANVPTTCGSAGNSYKDGQEALYTYTPLLSGSYTISYSGQTNSAIFVYSGGCPASGGTCVGSVASSAATQSLTVSLTSGTLYYIWFDTGTTPDSPCPGTFSIEPPGCITLVPFSGSNSVTTCNCTIQDHAGSGNYSYNANGYTVIYPSDPTKAVQLTGTYSVEQNWATIWIYNGAGTGGTLLAYYSGTGSLPATIISSGPNIPLTVRFTNIGLNQFPGFNFTSSCAAPPACASNPTSPSDGQTGVSEGGATLSWPAISGATGYDVYFGTTSPAPTLVSSNQSGTTYATGVLSPLTTYYWRIVPKNVLGAASGCTNWSFTTNCTVLVPYSGSSTATTCSCSIQDHAGSGNYGADANGYTVIYPSDPSQAVQLTGTYNIEYGYDYIYIYNGAGTGGTLLGTFAGTGSLPATIISSGPNIPLTVRFTSDFSIQYTGFDFTPSCITLTPPDYRASWVSMNTGASTWCAGETRNISVTVQNTGSATWTNAGPDINIGVKWNTDADYFIRVDANNLAPNDTATYNFTVTAPLSTGSNSLSFDIVNDGNCWFGDNDGSCGPGNVVYTSSPITISSAPTANAGSDATICSGGSTILNGTASGATSFSWSPTTGLNNPNIANPIASPTSTTTYTFTTTQGSCSNSDQVVVTVQTPPVANAGPDLTICPGTATLLNGTAPGATSFSWSPATGLSNPNIANPLATPGSTTTYTLTTSVVDGIQSSQLTYNESFTSGVIPTTQAINWCNFRSQLLDSYAYTSLTIRGSQNPIGITLTDPVAVAAIANAMRTATYYSVVSEGNTWNVGTGCIEESSPCSGSGGVVLHVNATRCVCNEANPNYYVIRPEINNLNWGGINTQMCDSPSQTMEVTFTYNSAGCSSTDQVVVTVEDTTPPSITCPTNISVAGTNGSNPCSTTVTYTAPEGTDNCSVAGTALFSGLASGSAFPQGTNTVTYQVTDGSGNTATCSFTVTVGTCNAPPVAICQSVSVNADGNCQGVVDPNQVDNGSYDPDLDDITLSLSPAGPYALGTTSVTLTVTDTYGATATCSTTITVTDVTGPTLNCQTNPILILLTTGSATIASYNVLDPFAADPSDACGLVSLSPSEYTFTCDDIGIHTITLTAIDDSDNSSTCNATVNVTDTENPVANCPSNIIQAVLPGQCGAVVSFSVPAANDNCSATSVANPASGSAFGPGTSTVTITATDGAGNTGTCSFTVTVTDSGTPIEDLMVSIYGNNNACIGYPFSLSASSAGATTYVWSGPNGFTANTASWTINSAAATMSGTYTVTVTNAGGCTATASKDVTITNSTPMVTGTTELCVGASLVLVASGGNTYSWAGPNGYTATGSSITRPMANTTMSGTYTVTVSNATGCTGVATIPVVVYNPPSATISGTTPVCSGGTISLSVPAGAVSYQWSGPGGFSASGASIDRSNASTTMAGTYTVTVTNAGGCSASASKTISVSAPTTANITGATTACVGGSISLTCTTAGVAYAWSGPGGYSSSGAVLNIPSATSTNAGTYTVSVTNASGCISTASRTITLAASPAATIANYSVCGNRIYLIASGGNYYAWSGPNGYTGTSTIVLVRPPVYGTYTVTVTNTTGCSTTASITISCKNGEEFTSENLIAYPNPTDGQTTISFISVEAERMKLSVYSVEGKEVGVLFDGITSDAATYAFEFDMNLLPSGTYYAVLRGEKSGTKQLRLTVIK